MDYVNQAPKSVLDLQGSSISSDNNSIETLSQIKKPVSSRKRLVLARRFSLDITLIYGSFLLAYFLRYFVFDTGTEVIQVTPVSFSEYLSIGLLYTSILFVLLNLKKFYALPPTLSRSSELFLIGNAVLTSVAMVTITILLIEPTLPISRLMFIFLIPSTWAVLSSSRAIAWLVQATLWKKGIGTRNLIVVGATDTGARLMRTAAQKAQLNYKLVGFVDDQLRYSDWTIPARYGNSIKRTNQEVPYLGTTDQLSNLIRHHKVDEVMIALPVQDHQMVNKLVRQCRENHTAFTLVPDLYELQPNGLQVRQINGVPIFITEQEGLNGFQFALKRTVDILGSLALILITAIPMLIIAIAVKLESTGPIIFRQTRVGKDGKNFTLYKFRSMHTDADARLAELLKLNETNGATFKMKNDPRVTKVGRFIRRTSLDELPQFFNILFGHMSLVGPRPALPREVVRYENWQTRRLETLPGLTGLWQVNGRSSVSFEEMVKLDIYYAEHWSLSLDFQILLKTFKAVVKGDGAY